MLQVFVSNHVHRFTYNKALKVRSRCSLDSLQRRMLRILRAVSGCPLARRYVYRVLK